MSIALAGGDDGGGGSGASYRGSSSATGADGGDGGDGGGDGRERHWSVAPADCWTGSIVAGVQRMLWG